jgi:histidine ammonia-lyase
MTPVVLDGGSLTIEQLVVIARHGARVERDPSTDARVARSEALIAQVVDEYRAAYAQGSFISEYGVTTGFGEFKDRPIAPEDLEQLQRNLLLSHSVGVGENSDAVRTPMPTTSPTITRRRWCGERWRPG